MAFVFHQNISEKSGDFIEKSGGGRYLEKDKKSGDLPTNREIWSLSDYD